MGTNYYCTFDHCSKCKRHEHEHIGKLPMGWTFLFHSIEHRKLKSWRQWKAFLKSKSDVEITDEYGQVLSVDDFIKIVKESNTMERREHSHREFLKDAQSSDHWDGEGFIFSEGDFC